MESLLPSTVYTEQQDTDSQATVEGGIQLSAPETVEERAVKMLKRKEQKLKETKSKNKGKLRKTISKIVAGKEITTETILKIKEHEHSSTQTSSKKSESSKKAVPPPQPGPSSTVRSAHSDSSQQEEDDEVCCVCNRFSPMAVQLSASCVTAASTGFISSSVHPSGSCGVVKISCVHVVCRKNKH